MNDPVRVMLVDDSAVVRGMVARFLEEDAGMKVVASVSNGEMAVREISLQPVDIVVLDVEMPVMDGLTALPLLLAAKPRPKVIMVSTLTHRNAEVSLRALSLGASDYVPKPSARNKHEVDHFRKELVDKIRSLALAGEYSPVAHPQRSRAEVEAMRAAPASTKPMAPMPAPAVSSAPARSEFRLRPGLVLPPKALAIGSSTGGPEALKSFFLALKGKQLGIPIFITQHMPAMFTAIFAENLNKTAGVAAREAADGMKVKADEVYIAPGDFHMVVEGGAAAPVIRLNQNPPENFCRPAVDPMLRSLADIYKDRLLAAIFTGMGSDGLLGCQRVAELGGEVIAQDQATSTVWGMPAAVAKEGVCTAVLPLGEMSSYVARKCGAA